MGKTYGVAPRLRHPCLVKKRAAEYGFQVDGAFADGNHGDLRQYRWRGTAINRSADAGVNESRLVEKYELIKNAYADLLAEGKNLSQGKEKLPNRQDYSRFFTAALNLIRRSCGEDSDHYRELRRLSESKLSSNNPTFFPDSYGVLEAAKRDFESGLLFDMRALITAEILGDFIEQAETLLDAGYHVPAASLAGAVLEDTLRKLCEGERISTPSSTKIDSLNAELARAKVYNKLIQKRITAIADIRNNADHGHFDKFSKDDVEDMVKWIRRFSADYLN